MATSTTAAPLARSACSYSPNAGVTTSPVRSGPANARATAQMSSTEPAPTTTRAGGASCNAPSASRTGSAVGCG